MIKYLKTTGRTVIKFDTETEKVSTVDNISTDIDWLWMISEDGEFNDKKVEKGDIIIKLYGIGNSQEEYVIIRNNELTDYYTRLIEHKKQYEQICNESNCCEKASM